MLRIIERRRLRGTKKNNINPLKVVKVGAAVVIVMAVELLGAEAEEVEEDCAMVSDC
jgi:hypothetical protein